MGYSKQVPHLQEECFVCVEHIHYELSSSCIGNDEHTNLTKTWKIRPKWWQIEWSFNSTSNGVLLPGGIMYDVKQMF